MMYLPVQVVDSHTGGEPTRIVVKGGPDLEPGTLVQQREQLLHQHDNFRRAIIHEPRGTDHLVGGILCTPSTPDCHTGVVFFNNVGYLGMCGHGMIGLVETLVHLGRIVPGEHRIETPAGIVTARLSEDRRVTIENVPSYRFLEDVAVDVPSVGIVTGDVAWGGNWFFLAKDLPDKSFDVPLTLDHVDLLTQLALSLRHALRAAGITGRDGAEIDHIEFFGPPTHPDADSRNFVLCPGGAYDRSPCGTGTSAKVACLIESGMLQPGETYCQESITGSRFQACARREGDLIIPSITGRAHVYAESVLRFDEDDPLKCGVSE